MMQLSAEKGTETIWEELEIDQNILPELGLRGL